MYSFAYLLVSVIRYVERLYARLRNWSFWLLVLSTSLTWAIFCNWTSLFNTILRPLEITQSTASYIGTYSNILTVVASFVAGAYVLNSYSYKKLKLKNLCTYVSSLKIAGYGSGTHETIYSGSQLDRLRDTRFLLLGGCRLTSSCH